MKLQTDTSLECKGGHFLSLSFGEVHQVNTWVAHIGSISEAGSKTLTFLFTFTLSKSQFRLLKHPDRLDTLCFQGLRVGSQK
jgi:hypothetical protein